MKTIDDFREILDAIVIDSAFYDNAEFRLMEKGNGFLLQLIYDDEDVDTRKVECQHARKWYLSPYMTETEVVDTAFAALARSALHRAGEAFTYCGMRTHSPHLSIRDRLIASHPDRLDRRPTEVVESEGS